MNCDKKPVHDLCMQYIPDNNLRRFRCRISRMYNAFILFHTYLLFLQPWEYFRVDDLLDAPWRLLKGNVRLRRRC